MPDEPFLPRHVEDTVQSIAELHLQHHRQASPAQRLFNRVTGFMGQPRFVGLLTLAFAAWTGLNLMLRAFGRAFDPAPFVGLAEAASFLSVYIALLILITQRHENALVNQRERLMLELAMLSDRKSAKIIELLEELRRDHPDLANRVNREAAEMSKPADAQAVLDAIETSESS